MNTENQYFKLFNPYTFIVIFISLIVYIWFSTLATWKIFNAGNFPAQIATVSNSVPFDNLGENLLKGSAEVNPEIIKWEAFNVNGMIYMYFNPFPAIIRIVPNSIFPNMYGRWARTSCLIAALLAGFFFSLILKILLFKNENLSLNEKQFLFNIFLAGFMLGTPVVFLLSECNTYHETIIWGFSCTISAMYFLFSYLYEGKKLNNIFGLSIACGCGLLSKPTFGISLYMVLLIVIVNFFYENNKKLPLKMFLFLLPAMLALLFQFWYNYERFNSIFSFGNYKYHGLKVKVFVEDSIFRPSRIPTSFSNYFNIKSEYFTSFPPYINLPKVNITGKENIFYVDQDSRIISLIIVSMWLFFTSVSGANLLFTKYNFLLNKYLCFGFFINCFFMLNFFAMSQRYSTEFIPFMIFLSSFFLLEVGKENFLTLKKKDLFKILLFMVIFSVATTFLSTLRWTLDHLWEMGHRERLIPIMKIIDFKK